MSKPVIKKPGILSDEDIGQIVYPDDSAWTLITKGRAVAQAQNDYCYKEMLRQLVEWLKENTDTCENEYANVRCLPIKAFQALQSLLGE